MALPDFSKFTEAQAERKAFNLNRTNRKRRKMQLGTNPKRMPMSMWRARVKHNAEPVCDRCFRDGEWPREGYAHRVDVLNVHILYRVLRGGQDMENAALVCDNCIEDYYAYRPGFKMPMHYANWIARYRTEADVKEELLASSRPAKPIEEIDDAELERLLSEHE